MPTEQHAQGERSAPPRTHHVTWGGSLRPHLLSVQGQPATSHRHREGRHQKAASDSWN